MEGVLFIPLHRPRRPPELVCTECGQLFRPRRIGDGAEELCDRCYGAQFDAGTNGAVPPPTRTL